jgi:hypothetical protein
MVERARRQKVHKAVSSLGGLVGDIAGKRMASNPINID